MIETSAAGLATAFIAGTVSFLSPCVLPLVPGYLSYIAGGAATTSLSDQPRRKALGLGLCFVLGFATVFVLLGASATALGRLVGSYRYELNLVAGALVVLFGVLMMGVIRAPWLYRERRFHPAIVGGKPFAAYLLGLAFGFGWTPCIGPVLGAILTLSATSATLADGIALLGVYALGLGIPFLMAAASIEIFVKRLRFLRRLALPLQRTAGGLMIVFGVLMFSGKLTTLSYWLLETFPALSAIG
ncbi:MAG TPA: cytochrome c biogenesis protein CcdA [Candidatus Competibacteraceae bacterium]|nr:cytochrome c biogenesis protein CcdA [Candidatus Competibacteraceae bacterium]